jgi:hypothetical protein
LTPGIKFSSGRLGHIWLVLTPAIFFGE